MRRMKILPKLEISDELDAQINEAIKVSGLRRADVIREALRLGLPKFPARFQTAPRWLEAPVREALSERAEPITHADFGKRMKVIIG